MATIKVKITEMEMILEHDGQKPHHIALDIYTERSVGGAVCRMRCRPGIQRYLCLLSLDEGCGYKPYQDPVEVMLKSFE